MKMKLKNRLISLRAFELKDAQLKLNTKSFGIIFSHLDYEFNGENHLFEEKERERKRKKMLIDKSNSITKPKLNQLFIHWTSKPSTIHYIDNFSPKSKRFSMLNTIFLFVFPSKLICRFEFPFIEWSISTDPMKCVENQLFSIFESNELNFIPDSSNQMNK